MRAYGYGILRPFLEKMLERMTIIDKLFLAGIVVIMIARTIPTSTTPIEPLPTIPNEAFGFVITYKATQNTLLSKTDSIKSLVFVVAGYLIAKVGELTNKKKNKGELDEDNYL